MRLTLRTMLAYLDDILEPDDARELGQKIEESKFASDLVQRIRGSTRRLRLAAPKLDGKGMAADANSVAEYLDNVMPPDRVPEFEKVCLESDVHLAEVASAHQVLTLVLGEPAIFDPSLRERMYALGDPAAAQARDAAARESRAASRDGNGAAHARGADEGLAAIETADESASEAAPVVVPVQGRPGRGEQAGGPRRAARSAGGFPLKSMAITLLLCFAISIVALLAMGELGPNHPVLRFFVGGRGDTAQSDRPEVPAPNETSRSAGEPPTDVAPESGSPTAPLAGGVDSATDAAVGSREPASALPELPAAGVDADRPATAPAAEPIVEPTAPATSSVPSTSAPPGDAPTGRSPVDPFEGTPVLNVPDKLPGGASVAADQAPPAVSSTVREVSPAPINTGLLLSEDQLLARLDQTDGTWLVLPPDTPLAGGDKLLSLPTYRPQILLGSSIKVTLSGEAAVKVQVPDATNLPYLGIHFGRAVLVPVGEAGGSLKIEIGERSGILNFPSAESAAAIEVRRYLPPGANPAEENGMLVTALWPTSGEVEWLDPQREPVKLAAGKILTAQGDSDALLHDSGGMPSWVDGKNLSDIERRASQELRRFLTADRPLSLSLMEQTSSRQVEVRSLACRSLCYLDIYEPALESFGDEQHRSYWHTQLDAIQSSMAHGTESAARLNSAADKLFMEKAPLVFRLIRGYSPDQLSAGGASELVDALADSSMTVRVLANENLRRITGRTLLYRPEARPELEKAKVLRWRKLLDEGQLQYTSPPSPFPPAPPDVEPGKAAGGVRG